MELQAVTLSLLRDTESYLKHIAQADYTRPIPLLSQATIGQHTRHFLEFFQCLLQQTPGRCINYDHRKRSQQMENDPQFALQITRTIAQKLPLIQAAPPLQLEANYQPETAPPVVVDTNFERELLYNIEHTIHHLAIIKIGLQLTASYIELPEHFGIAASTMRHRSSRQVSE